jgi:hypothetical protein
MKKHLQALVRHLEKFISGEDVSVQWAKDAETLLDQVGILDEQLDELQDWLSLYRPEGGGYLYGRDAMDGMCRRIISHLKDKEQEHR